MTAGRRPDDVTRAAQDRRLVAMLMAGATTEQCAADLGLAVDTIRRRARTDSVRRALADAERETIERTSRAVQAAATHGLRVLLDAATRADVPWPTRMAAARSLVAFAGYPTAATALAVDAAEAEMDAAVSSLSRKVEAMRSRLIDAESREATPPAALPAVARGA